MAYRSQKEERPVERASVGIVADMVRQFADPYAFLRELVQNGIDAGATALEVGVGWDPSGEVTVSVADDGTGMDRATIEGPLLTLFASAKDGDDSKIGKYGVGFVSVFALAPRRVVVETWRADAAYRLTLFPDHRYELEEVEVAAASERSASGTVIAVQVEAGEAELPAFAARAEEALARWCSHARVPIFLSVTMGRETQKARIDRPLALPAVVTIH
ncbi:MAG: ATP-binding protein [Myxococcales bacterium]|nr:ATP-binding protein [Myxococcales bacterium]